MLIKPLLHSSVSVAYSKRGILLPCLFPEQMTSWSPAHRSQQVNLAACALPGRCWMHLTSGSSICHEKQEPTAACWAGGGRIWSARCSPGTGRMWWGGVCVGLEKEEISAHLPAWNPFQERVLTLPKLVLCLWQGCWVCWPVMHPETVLQRWDFTLLLPRLSSSPCLVSIPL